MQEYAKFWDYGIGGGSKTFILELLSPPGLFIHFVLRKQFFSCKINSDDFSFE